MDDHISDKRLARSFHLRRQRLHWWLPAHRKNSLLSGTLLGARASTLSPALFRSHLGAQVAGVVVAARMDCVVMGWDTGHGLLPCPTHSTHMVTAAHQFSSNLFAVSTEGVSGSNLWQVPSTVKHKLPSQNWIHQTSL